ncbi:MAG: hypothetical protein E7311_02175 [Clostridiales bacterium]|nr:hypothetical protein [Clostridiales bacterium]
MGNSKKIILIIFIICFISVISGYMFVSNNKYDYTKQGFYDECTDYNENIETINKQEKVNINTEIILTDKYLLCNHEIDSCVDINLNNINKTYEEIEKMYSEYNINEFNNKYIRLKREVNKYCPYHYILKEVDNKIGIYNKIDEETIELFNILDININNLRENDKQLFKEKGIELYGQEELYEFIEDFDS